MTDEYLRYGFYVDGFQRVLTARQMKSRKIIRWIKNEAVHRAESDDISFSQWAAFLEDYLRDAPIIFIRKRARDGAWVEASMPTIRALTCDRHWFEDFVSPVPMDTLPRLPRREAHLRVWLLGSMLRAMKKKSPQ